MSRVQKLFGIVIFSMAACISVHGALSQTNSPARIASDVLTRLLEVDSLLGVLDGSGDMPPETIRVLEDQIAKLEAETYGPMTYTIDDYALSVGAIVGEGEGIIAEIDGVLDLAKSRRTELENLDVRDSELAEIETNYAVADRAVTDAMQVLENYLENGGMAADQMSGYPIFNNWQALHNEVAPRFSDRLSEIRRVRKDLGTYRQHLYEHVRASEQALRGLEGHTRRIREFREGQAVQNGDTSLNDWLNEMRDRGASIASSAAQVVAANQATRERVKQIQEAQAKAMREADLLNDVLAVVQAVVAVSGAATSTPPSTPTESPKINITINTSVTTYEIPREPLKPIDGVPIGGSGN